MSFESALQVVITETAIQSDRIAAEMIAQKIANRVRIQNDNRAAREIKRIAKFFR